MARSLTHFDESGAGRMVDVGHKPVTQRSASASGRVRMAPETLRHILDRKLAKGDVLEVARLAGIMGAKRTADLIPLCHPLALARVDVAFAPLSDCELGVTAVCSLAGQTGVEMEALTAVSITCLTIYDMCKAIDRGMVIEQIQLESKSGGKSGLFHRGVSAPTAADPAEDEATSVTHSDSVDQRDSGGP